MICHGITKWISNVTVQPKINFIPWLISNILQKAVVTFLNFHLPQNLLQYSSCLTESTTWEIFVTLYRRFNFLLEHFYYVTHWDEKQIQILDNPPWNIMYLGMGEPFDRSHHVPSCKGLHNFLLHKYPFPIETSHPCRNLWVCR